MKNMSDENLKSFIEKLGKMSESLMATSLSLQSTVKDLIDFKQLNSEEHKRIFNILELTTKRTENLLSNLIKNIQKKVEQKLLIKIEENIEKYSFYDAMMKFNNYSFV